MAGSGIDPIDQKAIRNLRKSQRSIPQSSQWAIADAAARPGPARAAGWLPPSVDEHVDTQFTIAYAQNG